MKKYYKRLERKNKLAAEFILKLSTFSVGPVIAAGIGFLAVPITTRLVNPYLYGQLSMFTTATSLLAMIMVLGSDQAYVRDYAESKDTGKLWLNSFGLPFIFSALLAFLAFFFLEDVSWLLFDENLFLPSLLFAMMLPIIILERYFMLSVRMHEAAKFYSTLNVLSKALIAVLTIFFVLIFGPGLWQLITPLLTASLIVVLIIMISRFKPVFSEWSFSIPILKRQLAFGLPLVITSAQFWILNSSDKIAIRTWSNYTEMGIYTAAFRLAIPLLIIKSSFSLFWGPLRYRWKAEGVSVKRFQKVSDIMVISLTLFYTAMLPLRWVIIYLLGTEYREAVHLVPLAMVFPLMYTLSETTGIGIGFSRKTYWDTVSTGMAAVINVFGNWFLVPKYGSFGAALSTAISFILFFWIRAIISNTLWKGIKLRIHLLATLIIIIINFLSLIYSDWRMDLIISITIIGILSTIFWKWKKRKENQLPFRKFKPIKHQ